MSTPHPLDEAKQVREGRSADRHACRVCAFFDRILQSTGAALLIVLCSPLFLVLAAVVFIADGRPILYVGERLGRSKKPFRMFKFRSLVHEAETHIGGNILNKRMAAAMQLEHRYGRFLRDTRLDELPQLFNVLRGDMDFVGPRPIRRQVYEKFGRQVKNFDTRFAVRPGLIGPSQVFTAHVAPPRLRAHLDNRFVRRKTSAWSDLGFVLYVFSVLTRNLFVHVARYTLQAYCTQRASGGIWERRRSNRIHQEETTLQLCSVLAKDFKTYITHESEEWSGPYRVVDINNESMLVESRAPIDKQTLDMRLVKNVALRGHIPRHRVCYVHGRVKFLKQGEHFADRYYYVIDYEAISPLNHYKIHQYFLGESVA